MIVIHTPFYERTLVLLEPDAIARCLVGRIIQRFEDALLTVTALKMMRPDRSIVSRHYHDVTQRHSPAAFEATVEFVCSGPVTAMVLQAVGVVAKVRSMAGPTWPQAAAPGTIRGYFAHQQHAPNATAANLVHASATVEEAHTEIGLWFTPSELFGHRLAADNFAMLAPILPTQTPGSQG